MPRTIAAVQTPGRRRRSESKRTAILDAAEALFLAEGYDHASVDAIAARAHVSKRTVYDHFHDKATVFLSTVGRVHEGLVATVRTAVDEELTPGRDLREALTAFALRVAAQAFPSSGYATFRRLTAMSPPAPRLPDVARDQPERMLEERFAALATDGQLQLADPHVAARHFTALTIRLALEARDDRHGDDETARTIIEAGVDAFLRAYC